jgi:hypothetical protein
MKNKNKKIVREDGIGSITILKIKRFKGDIIEGKVNVKYIFELDERYEGCRYICCSEGQ